MTRILSSEVFQANPNGTFFVKRPINVGGVYFDKVLFSRGVKVGDLDLTVLASKPYLEVTDNNGIYTITAYYDH